MTEQESMGSRRKVNKTKIVIKIPQIHIRRNFGMEGYTSKEKAIGS